MRLAVGVMARRADFRHFAPTAARPCRTCYTEPFAHRPDGGLGAIRDADLAEDVLHVLLDRLVADVQSQGDFLVGQAIGQLPQNFALALGERHFDVGGQTRRGQGAGHAAQFVARPGALSRGGRCESPRSSFSRERP